jgi:hypothetical protein
MGSSQRCARICSGKGGVMKKRYQLEYSGSSRMVIEVDTDVFTHEKFKECSDFWSNKPTFPDWLKMVYCIALRESVSSWNALRTLLDGREEGFPKVDGSEGITIVSFDEFEFDEFEIDCKEIA